MTQSYLPEWQLYLLKRLALDAKALNSRSLMARDFIFVSSSEAREAVEESLHQEMQYINSIPNRVYAGEKLQETLTSISLSRGYQPPEFKPVEVLQAFIEWSSEPNAPIQFKKIVISKDYFNIQEKKRIASISSGHPPFTETKRKMVQVSEDTFYNGMRELPKDSFKIGTLKSILGRNPNLADHIVFQLEIDSEKVNKKINGYLDEFKEQKLVPPKGSRYFAVEEQRARFLSVMSELEKKFGKNNISTNFREIIQMIGRGPWREESCRFYETIFLLEKEGAIKVVELRGLEIVFSILRNLGVKATEIERFNLEREFTKVQRIKDETQHRLVQENWQNVGFVLGEIIQALPPIKSRLTQSLSWIRKRFRRRRKRCCPWLWNICWKSAVLRCRRSQSLSLL